MSEKFLCDETGLELSEYAAAAALIAVMTATLFHLLGNTIGEKIIGLAAKVGLR